MEPKETNHVVDYKNSATQKSLYSNARLSYFQEPLKLAPNVNEGYIVNQIGNSSIVWHTKIQSVLVQLNKAEHPFFLSQETRLQEVFFNSMSFQQHKKQGIFKRNQPFEFLTFSYKDKFYQIPHMDTVVEASCMTSIPNIDIGVDGYIACAAGDKDWHSNIQCQLTKVKLLSVQAVYEGLMSEKLNITQLSMMLDWPYLGKRYRLFTPCKFIKYSNEESNNNYYIQIISGHCLAPIQSNLVTSYVACSLNNKGKYIVEFSIPRYQKISHWLEKGNHFSSGNKNSNSSEEAETEYYCHIYDVIMTVDEVNFQFYYTLRE